MQTRIKQVIYLALTTIFSFPHLPTILNNTWRSNKKAVQIVYQKRLMQNMTPNASIIFDPFATNMTNWKKNSCLNCLLLIKHSTEGVQLIANLTTLSLTNTMDATTWITLITRAAEWSFCIVTCCILMTIMRVYMTFMDIWKLKCDESDPIRQFSKIFWKKRMWDRVVDKRLINTFETQKYLYSIKLKVWTSARIYLNICGSPSSNENLSNDLQHLIHTLTTKIVTSFLLFGQSAIDEMKLTLT